MESVDSQKRENLLNLALEVSQQEREQSLELGVGVLDGDRWELIIKYHGDLFNRLKQLEQEYDTSFQAEFLLPGYAILTIERQYLDLISSLTEIDYIEKPKALYEEVITISQGNINSCVTELVQREPFLTGKGVLIGIPDSGIAYKDEGFLTKSGNTKIAFLWDQTVQNAGKLPEGFYEGAEFTREDIEQSIRENTEISFDRSGHGTAIADICAGEGAANESELLIVKLGSGNEQGFTRTTELMRAISWMLRKAVLLERPLVINISYGSTYGAHDGTTLLETFLNTASDVYKTAICVGSGNEGAAAGHVAQKLIAETEIEWSVTAFQRSLNISMWKNYVDQFDVSVISPGGQRAEIVIQTVGKQEYRFGETKLILYAGEPTPYSPLQEYYFEFQTIENGIWRIVINPIRIVDGYFSLYLPSAVVLNPGTNFFRASPETTLTIPSTADKVITVGAYNTVFGEYADFSGRGYEMLPNENDNSSSTRMESGLWRTKVQKPDLCAPGVDILVKDRNGGYQVVSGTSFATPFVAASVALMMEWGIVRGNDPYLYGEKVKAYLCRGAKPIRGLTLYPNEKVGYGALCVADSIPK